MPAAVMVSVLASLPVSASAGDHPLARGLAAWPTFQHQPFALAFQPIPVGKFQTLSSFLSGCARFGRLKLVLHRRSRRAWKGTRNDPQHPTSRPISAAGRLQHPAAIHSQRRRHRSSSSSRRSGACPRGGKQCSALTPRARHPSCVRSWTHSPGELQRAGCRGFCSGRQREASFFGKASLRGLVRPACGRAGVKKPGDRSSCELGAIKAARQTPASPTRSAEWPGQTPAVPLQELAQRG